MIGDEEMLRRVCEYAASHSDDPRTHVAAALVQGSTCVYAANRLPRDSSLRRNTGGWNTPNVA